MNQNAKDKETKIDEYLRKNDHQKSDRDKKNPTKLLMEWPGVLSSLQEEDEDYLT